MVVLDGHPPVTPVTPYKGGFKDSYEWDLLQ